MLTLNNNYWIYSHNAAEQEAGISAGWCRSEKMYSSCYNWVHAVQPLQNNCSNCCSTGAGVPPCPVNKRRRPCKSTDLSSPTPMVRMYAWHQHLWICSHVGNRYISNGVAGQCSWPKYYKNPYHYNVRTVNAIDVLFSKHNTHHCTIHFGILYLLRDNFTTSDFPHGLNPP